MDFMKSLLVFKELSSLRNKTMRYWTILITISYFVLGGQRSFAESAQPQRTVKADKTSLLQDNFIYIDKNSKTIRFLDGSQDQQANVLYKAKNVEIIEIISYDGKDKIAAVLLSDFLEGSYKTSVVFLSIDGKILMEYHLSDNRTVISLSFDKDGGRIALITAYNKREFITNYSFRETFIDYELNILNIGNKEIQNESTVILPNKTRLSQKAWLSDHLLVAESYDFNKKIISLLLIDCIKMNYEIITRYNGTPQYFGKIYPSVYSNDLIGLVEGDKYILKDRYGSTVKTLISKGARETYEHNLVSIDSPVYWINKQKGFFINRLGEVVDGWYFVEVQDGEVTYTKLPDMFNEFVEDEVVPMFPR